MTTVIAYKVGRPKGQNTAVLIADSMGSLNPDRKSDNQRKLYTLADCLVMGSGDSNYFDGIIERVSTSGVSGANNIALQIVDIAKREVLDPRRQVGMIVVGADHDKVKILDVYANHPELSDRDKIVECPLFAMAGSGSSFAYRFLKASASQGMNYMPEDISEGLCLIRGLADESTEMASVNDKFQYGIVKPDGLHIVLPANLSFDSVNTVKYTMDLFGVAPEDIGHGCSLEDNIARVKNKPIGRLAGEFYTAINDDIDRVNCAAVRYRSMSELFLKGRISIEQLNGFIDLHNEAMKKLDEGIRAWTSRDPREMIKYVKSRYASNGVLFDALIQLWHENKSPGR